MYVERGGGTVSLELVEAIRTGTSQTAAELALVRLAKERNEASSGVHGLERIAQEETQSREAFKKQDLMSNEDAVAASNRAAALALEVKRDGVDVVMGPAYVIVILVGLLIVLSSFASSGFWGGLGALILCGIIGVVVLFVVSIVTEGVNSSRQNQAKKDLEKINGQLARHRAALALQGIFSGAARTTEQLQRARTHLARIEKEIEHNRDIVRLR
jgi:hypothetical protein